MNSDPKPGWSAKSAKVDDKTTVIHVSPVDDIVEHNLEESCVCGTDSELWTDKDFTKMCVIVTHNSLDGREAHEKDYE